MTHPRTGRATGILRGSTALMTFALAAAVAVTSFTGSEPVVSTAQAQDVSLTVQFRTALEPHGRWQRHGRWGEVWIPARRDRDWRPYTAGRWIYTDEWGWYWVSDEEFGWVTYHYGRWVLTAEYGWVWIPGNEWGPAWVQWRRGDRHAGWAPLPPQQVIYDYDDNPDFWIFVSFNNFTARNIRTVILPPRERVVVIRQTVVVNRTIIVDGDRDRRGRFAVNPGIEPRIVAARVGRPIQVANVKPVVVAGTVGVSSAVEIRAEEARKQRNRTRVQITETKERVEPTKDVPPPQALKKGEEGRFGDRPPRAAKEQAQRQQQPDGAKSTAPAATKSGADDAAKSKASDDAAKAKTDDAAKSKAADDAAKARKGDAAKSKSEDDAKATRSKAPEPKGEVKSQAKDADKGKSAEPKQAAPKAEPKSAPEPKQAAPKAQPKSAPEPKQAAPKAEPKSAPEPKQVAPKQSAPEPKQAAPKAAPAPQQAAPKAAPSPQAAPKAAPPPQAAPAPQQAAPKAAPPAAPAPKAAPKGNGQEKEKQ